MKQPLNEGWEFLRGNPSHNAEVMGDFWRAVTLPHDWSIEDIPGLGRPFDFALSDGGPACGWTVGGYGWYRKSLKVEEGLYEIRFDGIMGLADIYLDGKHQLFHPYGYSPVILRAKLEAGEHVLTVRVRSLGSHTRWYSGSGIYRQATLQRLGEGVRLSSDGLWAVTLAAAEEEATVEIRCEVEVGGQARWKLVSPGGFTASEGEVSLREGANSWQVKVLNPKLWSLWDVGSEGGEQPLYRVELEAPGLHETCPLGIRTFEVSAAKGLWINGQRARLNGGCLHHDLGILGAAAHPEAEARRVRLLKKAGFNAIRTSHNPPSRAFLEACDREGIFVMDEAFDEWVSHKTPDSYALHFDEWCEKDIEAIVKRDRSHPCVFYWSIGNEIPDSYTRPDIAARLREAVLRFDETRPITAGICKPWWNPAEVGDWATDTDVAFESLDAGGYNYLWQEAEADGDRVPDRVIMHTESFALEASEGRRHAFSFPRVLGDFVWTMMDYIGESGIGQLYLSPGDPVKGMYPWRLAVCGDLDLLGHRKPPSYWREALWREGVLALSSSPPPEARGMTQSEFWHHRWGYRPVEQHWNWSGFEGTPVQVEVASSCDRIELFLNGKKVGEAETGEAQNRIAHLDVAYEPGELLCVGWKGSEKVEARLVTAGEARFLAARVEEGTGSLAFVWVEAVDEQGVVNPACSATVGLKVTGEAELLAFGNAAPADPSSLQDSVHSLWMGRALAVLRLSGPASIALESDGLASAVLELPYK